MFRILDSALICLLVAQASALSAGKGARVDWVLQMDPEATYSTDGKTFTEVQPRQRFLEGTRILTNGSRLGVRYDDGTVVRLMPHSDLTIDHEDGASRTFSLLAGAARFLVEKLGSGGSLDVRTPNAVCAVKGTDFEVAVEPARTLARVYATHATAGLEVADSGGRQRLLVHAGEESEVLPAGVIQPRPIPAEVLQQAAKRFDAITGEYDGAAPVRLAVGLIQFNGIQRFVIRAEGLAAGPGTITVYDAAGAPYVTVFKGGLDPEDFHYWDAHGPDGRPAAPGTYRIEVESQGRKLAKYVMVERQP
jgi:hypothetical protein